MTNICNTCDAIKRDFCWAFTKRRNPRIDATPMWIRSRGNNSHPKNKQLIARKGYNISGLVYSNEGEDKCVDTVGLSRQSFLLWKRPRKCCNVHQ